MKLKHPADKTVPGVWHAIYPRQSSLHHALTAKGRHFFLWRARAISKDRQKHQRAKGIDTSYACHGFTVGSYRLKGGPYTPYGDGIDLLLEDEFHSIDSSELQNNDVVVWRDEDGDISHSARITWLYRQADGSLSLKTRLITKNGAGVLNHHMRLATLILKYGPDISFYRENEKPSSTAKRLS